MSDNESASRMMNVEEAASYLGISKYYLYQLAEKSRITSYKPTGGRIFFRRDDLEKFLFNGRRAARFELEQKAETILNGA
jgi:excisionase family DNA binding protein